MRSTASWRMPSHWVAVWQASVMTTLPASYRRRGPEGPWPPSLLRRLDDVSGTVNRWLRGERRWPRVVAAASVPAAVGLIAARRRVGMHPALTLPLGCV